MLSKYLNGHWFCDIMIIKDRGTCRCCMQFEECLYGLQNGSKQLPRRLYLASALMNFITKSKLHFGRLVLNNVK